MAARREPGCYQWLAVAAFVVGTSLLLWAAIVVLFGWLIGLLVGVAA